jgi:hypothetical protein
MIDKLAPGKVKISRPNHKLTRAIVRNNFFGRKYQLAFPQIKLLRNRIIFQGELPADLYIAVLVDRIGVFNDMENLL